MAKMVLSVEIIEPATGNNGGLIRFPSGRKIILSKTDAAGLCAAQPQAGEPQTPRKS